MVAASGIFSMIPEGDTFTTETSTVSVPDEISAGPTSTGGSRSSSRLSVSASMSAVYRAVINAR